MSRDSYYRLRLEVDYAHVFYSEETYSHERAIEVQDRIAGHVGLDVAIEMIEQVHREHETGRRPLLCEAGDCREFAKRVFGGFCSESCRLRSPQATEKDKCRRK